jgi:hypothetical protein
MRLEMKGDEGERSREGTEPTAMNLKLRARKDVTNFATATACSDSQSLTNATVRNGRQTIQRAAASELASLIFEA